MQKHSLAHMLWLGASATSSAAVSAPSGVSCSCSRRPQSSGADAAAMMFEEARSFSIVKGCHNTEMHYDVGASEECLASLMHIGALS